MNWLLRIGAGLLLLLGSATTAFAATTGGGETPSTAIGLSETAPATGTLTGSAAGAFAYYTFQYPGNGSQGTLTLSISPNDPSTANAVGVNVYQAGATLATANAVGPTPGTNSVTFSSTTAGPILVQVYNYSQGEAVGYQLSLSGITAPAATPSSSTAPTSSPAPAPAGASASSPISLTGARSGQLPGNTAGSYVYYTLDYPGDGSTQTVNLSFSPAGADVANAVFLNVYQNGTLLTSVQGTAGPALGQLVASYSSTTKGPVLIQIANYNAASTISYTISP